MIDAQELFFYVMVHAIGLNRISCPNQFKSMATVVHWLAMLPHSKKFLGVTLGRGVSAWSFPCSCAWMSSIWVLQLPPTIKKHVNWGIG